MTLYPNPMDGLVENPRRRTARGRIRDSIPGPLSHTDQGEHSFRFRFFFEDGLAASDMDMLHADLIEPFGVIRESG